LNGPIPASVYDVVGLEYLDLSSNQFSGTVSDSIGNFGIMRYLYVISRFIVDLFIVNPSLFLHFRDMSSNNLTGKIPSLNYLVNLAYL